MQLVFTLSVIDVYVYIFSKETRRPFHKSILITLPSSAHVHSLPTPLALNAFTLLKVLHAHVERKASFQPCFPITSNLSL